MKIGWMLLSSTLLLAGCFPPHPLRPAQSGVVNVVTVANTPAYSFMSPAGNWSIWVDWDEVKRPGDAGTDWWKGSRQALLFPDYIVSFRWMVTPRIKFTVDTAIDKLSDSPQSTTNDLYKRSTLVLSGHVDQAIQYMKEQGYTSERATEVLGAATDISLSSYHLHGLTCIKRVQGGNVGPSPDPAESGQWAGLGNFTKETSINCPLKRDGYVWNVFIDYGFLANDVLIQKSPANTVSLLSKALENKVQQMLDTLHFYGFTQ